MLRFMNRLNLGAIHTPADDHAPSSTLLFPCFLAPILPRRNLPRIQLSARAVPEVVVQLSGNQVMNRSNCPLRPPLLVLGEGQNVSLSREGVVVSLTSCSYLAAVPLEDAEPAALKSPRALIARIQLIVGESAELERRWLVLKPLHLVAWCRYPCVCTPFAECCLASL